MWNNDNSYSNITVKRCEIYSIYGGASDSDSTGISWSRGDYITIGGADGDGNKIYNIGKGTGSGDLDVSGGPPKSNNCMI